MMVQVGDKVKFDAEKQRYTVRARDSRFVIMTKPFNLRKTYLYTIADLQRGVRGADSMIFGSIDQYDTPEGAEENLKRLQSGEMEVSYRNVVPLSDAEIEILTI